MYTLWSRWVLNCPKAAAKRMTETALSQLLELVLALGEGAKLPEGGAKEGKQRKPPVSKCPFVYIYIYVLYIHIYIYVDTYLHIHMWM